MAANNNSGNESSDKKSKLINLFILVGNGGKIELADAISDPNIDEKQIKDIHRHKFLEITPNIDKGIIISFIKERIESNKSIFNTPINYSKNQDTGFRHRDDAKQIPPPPNVSVSSKKPTPINYVEYKPDDAYDKNKDKPNEFTDNDVMIYLSEIRRKNNGTVPAHLKSLHDALYKEIDKGITNTTEWSTKDNSKYKQIFDKIFDFKESENHFKGYNARFTENSYKTVKSRLDTAFNKIFSNKGIPKVYSDALKSMQKAIDSHTAFKYPSNADTDTIFNEYYIYSNEGNYKIIKDLTTYLNNTVFDRFNTQTPKDGKYPPSIKKDKSKDDDGEACVRTIPYLVRTRRDECFEIFKNSENNEVVLFLKFISSKLDSDNVAAQRENPVINKKDA